MRVFRLFNYKSALETGFVFCIQKLYNDCSTPLVEGPPVWQSDSQQHTIWGLAATKPRPRHWNADNQIMVCTFDGSNLCSLLVYIVSHTKKKKTCVSMKHHKSPWGISSLFHLRSLDIWILKKSTFNRPTNNASPSQRRTRYRPDASKQGWKSCSGRTFQRDLNKWNPLQLHLKLIRNRTWT